MSTPPNNSNTNASSSSITKAEDKDGELILFQGPPNKNATHVPSYAKHDPEGIL